MNTQLRQGIIGCEVEVYKTPEGFMLMDLNPGKVGGAKRIGGFAALENPGLEAKLERIAQAHTYDIQGDAYIVTDIPISAQIVNGRRVLSPFLMQLKHSIEDRGHAVKGFIGREKTFSAQEDNFKHVVVDENGIITGISFDRTVLADVAGSHTLYLGCHFAPACLKDAELDEDTRRNGLINNFLDLPGVSPKLLRGMGRTAYEDAFIFYTRKSGLKSGQDLPATDNRDELKSRIREFQKVGHSTVVVKDLMKISIGGRNVEFIPIDNILEDRLDSVIYSIKHPAFLVMPCYPIETIDYGRGPVRLQTRILYSSPQQPELVVAKQYPINETQNLSGFCETGMVYDLNGGLHFLHTPEKGTLEIERADAREMGNLVHHFETAVESCFPSIAQIEGTLRKTAGTHAALLDFFRKKEKQGLIPSPAYACLNNFTGDNR